MAHKIKDNISLGKGHKKAEFTSNLCLQRLRSTKWVQSTWIDTLVLFYRSIGTPVKPSKVANVTKLDVG